MSNTKNLANLAAALDDGTSGQVLLKHWQRRGSFC